MNENKNNFSQLLKDFQEKRPDKEISKSVIANLKSLTSIDPIIGISKLMEQDISELIFINGAEEIDNIEFKFGYCDPPHNSKMALHIKGLMSKYGEKTLARLLVFLKRRFAQLTSQAKNYKEQYELAEKEITGLASGKAIFVSCEACKGKGKFEDDNEEMTQCWVCNGRGKIIFWRNF